MSGFFYSEGMFAIYGVIVGAVLTWLGEYVRQATRQNKQAKYLSIRTTIALDAYIRDCASALTWEDPFPDPNENPDNSFKTPEKFQIPDDVDWTSILVSSARKILEIPQRHAEAEDAVRVVYDLADGVQAQSVRDERFLAIALDAIAVAGDLRNRYNLPKKPVGDWDPETIIADLHTKWSASRERGQCAVESEVP